MLKRLCFIMFLIFISCICNAQNPSGPYFGQTPPGKTPEIFAPGIISVAGRFEQSITDSPDGNEFYFSVTNSSWDSYKIWVVKEEANGWGTPAIASFSQNYNNLEAFISPDGQWMYFISTRPPGAAPWSTDIWMMSRDGNGWSELENIPAPVHSSPAGEWGVCVTSDRTLYFGSDRSGGKGLGDIYRSEFINGSYALVENLGDSINTGSAEYDPYIAPDESYLIFQSKSRRGGFGDNDLYISFKKDDGSWTTAVNMGADINTKVKEINPSVSKDGKYLFFTRRTSSEADIYWVDAAIIEQLRPAIPYFGEQPPGSTPKVFAPGIISLEGRFEQNAAFTPNGKEFYFGTTNSGWDKFDLYYTKQIKDNWIEPENATSLLGNYDNTEPFITHDGQKLFFVSPRPSAPPWNTDIYFCERNDTAWSSPQKIESPVSTNSREWHPSVSMKGTLYFQSLNRAGGFGAADIYRAELKDGQYTTVENLGENINSRYGDGEATIAQDESYLIFTSYRPGYGESDIYISFNKNNSWTEPINLGPKINTSQNEYGTALSPDGKYLFFTRRKAWVTDEDSDIWWVSTSFIDSLKIISSIENENSAHPNGFNLYQNYPNPFNPETTIKYSLKNRSKVMLNIYNLSGVKVRTLINSNQPAGHYQAIWDSTDDNNSLVSSGLYMCELRSNEGIRCMKMLLIR